MLSDEIDRCWGLFCTRLSEPRDNSLRVLVEEARPDGTPRDIVLAGVVISGTEKVISSPSFLAFELDWPSYIAYSVRNESFIGNDDYERCEGGLLCVYSVSHFLDYTRKATFATSDFPAPFRHYGIHCLDHVVDVISVDAPRITRVR